MRMFAVVLQLVGMVAVPVAVWGLWGAWWALLVFGAFSVVAGVEAERELA